MAPARRRTSITPIHRHSAPAMERHSSTPAEAPSSAAAATASPRPVARPHTRAAAVITVQIPPMPMSAHLLTGRNLCGKSTKHARTPRFRQECRPLAFISIL